MLPYGLAGQSTGRLRGGFMSFQQIRTQGLFVMMFAFVVGILHVTAQQDTTPASSIPVASATVVDVKDKVLVQLPGQNFTAPALGQVLRPESEIKTDNGQIVLRLEDE